MIIAFGEFELDANTYRLRRAGSEIPLQPKVFDAIRYLIEHHGRVVPKQELLDVLWLGEHINATALPWTISRARKALGQSHDENQPIETVRGRGYRFTGEVRHVKANGSIPAPASSVQLLAQPPPPPSSRPAARSANDPFVGRAEVMDRLLSALENARAGQGRLCLLLGEAGIGKTRCISEFSRLASQRGPSVWTGRCLEEGRTAAFWPWVQVLRDALADGSLDPALQRETRSLLEEIIPSTRSRERSVDVAASSPIAARFWMLEKLSRHLLQCAEATPRVVLLEDAHWADDASLDLLVFLAAELTHTQALVVATARDASASASEAWAKVVNRLGPCERIELGGLKPSDVEHYVSEVTGLEVPSEIHRAVYLKSGGNPLFLQETARLLKACCDRDGVGSLRTEDITVPGVAREVLRARLTGLDPATCETLEMASAIGQEFELPLLQSACGIGADLLLGQLDQATRARLVAPRRRVGTYAFVHDTIREALYEDLSRARRVDLHFQIAEALEGRSAGDFRTNDLAYHFYRALPRAEPERVERYARSAGEAAMRGFAYEDASQFYGWALDAQRFRRNTDARTRCELLLAHATALRLSLKITDSRKAIAQAIDIASEHGFADLLWMAARNLRFAVVLAVVPDALALRALEDAAKLLSDDQPSLRIRVLGQLACIPPYSLSTERSEDLSGRAVALAREGTDPEDLIEALMCRLHVLSGPDRIDELLEATDEIRRLVPGVTSWQADQADAARFQALVPRHHALLHKGDMPAADSALAELGRLARRLRRPELLMACERFRATRAFSDGDFETAESEFNRLFAQSRRLRLPFGPVFYSIEMTFLAEERVGLSTLLGATRELEAKWNWAAAIPGFQAYGVRLLVEVGRKNDAREGFEAMAQHGFENITRDLGYLNTLANLSLVAVALEDRPRAESLYALMRPYPNHNTPQGFSFYMGSVSYFLGHLAKLLGNGDTAVRHFEDALAMNGRLGCVPQLARTQLALAKLLVDEGGRADRLRANALMAEAATTARRLEMAPLAAEADRLRNRLTLRSRSRSL
jgi:eukaryotic-like serine/threonine-protein kinase